MNGNPRGLCSFEEATTRYPRSTLRYTLNLSIFLILIPTYLCKLFLQKNKCLSYTFPQSFLQCTFINLQTLIFLMGIPQVGFPILCLSPLHLTLYPNSLYISYPNPTFLMQTLPQKKKKKIK